VAKRGSSFETGAYEKILSEYELARLQNPVSDEDRETFNGLPEDVRQDIQKGAYYQNGLKIKLDPNKIIFAFYKKQDYEPFAVPFGYPVLEDINAKLELKKMDQAITRTVENVILLITMGAEPEKGGINPNNLIAMQKLFKNESVGRVLVSDYTTKADFVIPDLNKVLEAYTPAQINKGTVDKIEFSGIAKRTEATGTMKFLYHDLDILLQLEDKAKWKNSVLSFAANTVVASSNPASANLPPKIVDYQVERDMNKSFINITLKSALAGLKETVIMSKENRKTYTEDKKRARKESKE
jgi:hypothetical protein